MSDNVNSPATSAFLTISMRWLDRLVGIVSTLILARLLVPDDFGIVAMATIVIGLADTLFAVGVHVPLIQNTQATAAHYDSAWTLRLIQTSMVALGLIVFAPMAADFFSEPRLTSVLRVLALLFVLEGLENIWTISFQKNMQFQKDFYFMSSKRLIAFFVTISLALLLGNYWAMILGNVAGRASGVLLSYFFHANRPRLNFEHLREIFSVSQWMMIKSAGDHLNAKSMSILIGYRTDTVTLGSYSLSAQIAQMPSAELVAPLNRVLFPMFSRASTNLLELRRLYVLAQSLQMLIALPACAGVALVASDFVPVVLGPNWVQAVPFIQFMAVFGLVSTMQSSGAFVLITLGKLRWLAFFGWGRLLIFCTIAIVLFPSDRAITIVQQQIAASAIGLAIYLWLLLRALPPVRLSDILASLYRPSLGIATMTATIFALEQATALTNGPALLAKCTAGAISYILAVVSLWHLGGRPQGAESYLLDLTRRGIDRIAGRAARRE